jgi:hypothetical protein
MPRRALSLQEAFVIAELQANRLLELAGLAGPPTPAELITELPRFVVRLDPDLPVSGSAQWANGRWLILLNSSEPGTRQRYSLMHEAKHCVDHRFRDVIYQDRAGLTADEQAERAADVFAACLLMPKRWVKHYWGTGHQRLSELAELFEVSPRAMAVRLQMLGLREPLQRGIPAPQRLPRQRPTIYNRRSRGAALLEVAP